ALGYLGPLILDLDPYGFDGPLRASPAWFGHDGPWLGTDDLGRDMFSRLVYGAQTSLGIGLVIVAVAILVGTWIGLVAGVYGGWIDAMIMRITDIVMTLPSILLAIVIVAVLGPSLLNAILAVIVVSIPRFVRVIRSAALGEAKKQYVMAA